MNLSRFLCSLLLVAAAALAQEKEYKPKEEKLPGPPVTQPIAYSHKTHVAMGMKCTNCHTMPGDGFAATFPKETMCMGCHTTVKKESPVSPGAMGFHEWLSHDNFFELDPAFSRDGGPPVVIKGESSALLIAEAIRAIDAAQRANRPFFLVVWFGSPHEPYQALPADLALYDDLPAKYATKKVKLTSNETGGPVTRPQGEVLRERYAEIAAMDRGRLLFVVNNPAFFVSHRLPMARAARDAGFPLILWVSTSPWIAPAALGDDSRCRPRRGDDQSHVGDFG